MKTDIERYHTNLRAEQEGAALYQLLAQKERNEHLAELYRRMADVEQRHASVWADHLRQAGEPVPAYTAGWRIRTLVWLAQRFGTSGILPMISTMERNAVSTYFCKSATALLAESSPWQRHETVTFTIRVPRATLCGVPQGVLPSYLLCEPGGLDNAGAATMLVARCPDGVENLAGMACNH